jgi:hypothetical protein
VTSRLRSLLLCLALLGVAATLADWLAWKRAQDRLGSFLERADAARVIPGLPERVRRANQPAEAALRATRPLVALWVDPTWLFDVPESDRLDVWQRSLRAVDEIRQIAARVLADNPTSWEAAMTYGVAAYLAARGSNMAVSPAAMDSWEVPLRAAQSLIPGYAEPTRYLALAYVNYWQSLSSGQRRAAMSTMSEAFRDQRTFDLIVELWLRYVPDERQALAAIPDEPHAWRRLESIFRRERDWDLYLECHDRLVAAEASRLDGLLDEAEARVAGGDYRRGTVLFHSALAALEPDGRNLARLVRVLDHMPAGPVGGSAAASLRRWLDWTLDLGFAREPPLAQRNLRRLAGSLPDLTLAEKALSGLMAGDLAAAEQSERRWPGALGEEWDRYLILKAQALLARGESAAARTALRGVRGSWAGHPTYLRVALAVGRATGDPAVPALAAALEGLPASTWRGGQMSWSAGTARLELVPSTRAAGLSIEFLDAPEGGMPVDVLWNGSAGRRRIAYPGRELRVEAAVTPESSMLELRPTDQRPFSPGRISLIDELPSPSAP